MQAKTYRPREEHMGRGSECFSPSPSESNMTRSPVEVYTKMCCMGSKLDKLEVHIQSLDFGVIKITET